MSWPHGILGIALTVRNSRLSPLFSRLAANS
jgi:hypothetical protein